MDSKSIPDKESVISVMTQSIRDVEIKDFIEETVEDCFDKMNTSKYYLFSNKEDIKISS